MGKKKELQDSAQEAVCIEVAKARQKTKWQKPQLADVSGKVMAQPYIRFT